MRPLHTTRPERTSGEPWKGVFPRNLIKSCLSGRYYTDVYSNSIGISADGVIYTTLVRLRIMQWKWVDPGERLEIERAANLMPLRISIREGNGAWGFRTKVAPFRFIL